MRLRASIAILGLLLAAHGADAQSKTNLQALQGLVPFSTLGNTEAGKAALAANYSITSAIQTGTASQPVLEPFPAQQEQALKDAFITSGNAYQLADGLGTKLGGAYQAVASFTSTDDGKTTSFTNLSPAVATLIAYTATLSGSDSNSGKFFFAGAVQKTTGPAVPISPAAAAILKNAGGKTDVFGTAYNKPAGSPGADPYGDSRPYQTETNLLKYTDPDFFNAASGNADYLYGPAQNLEKSPAFPSGHTTYGYTESMLLAILVPQRYTQMVARGAEYGNSRIVLGAHYAMDVIAGRTLAYYDLAHLLAGNPTYVGQTEGKVTITNYQAALKQAESDVTAALTKRCGESLNACAATDTSRFSNATTDEAFYEATQTYGLPPVYPAKHESVTKLAPEAGWLLKAAFPKLTLAQADHILTETEGPGGGFLDNGSAFGVYSRLDLFKAGEKAASLTAK
jgi:membrane-associated phospholipid phosphatase